MPSLRIGSPCCFATVPPLPPRRSRPSSSSPPRRPRTAVPNCSLLSAPFPPPDLFSVAVPAFTNGTLLPRGDVRPELLGSLLWTTALYLGVWGDRWGALLRRRLSSFLSEDLSVALHSLPFLFAGFGTDGALRAASGGDATAAVATGLSLALYAAVAEMARSGERVERERSPAEVRRMKVFDEFAERGLRRNGRCHLVDVRAALKADAEARAAGQASDAELRQAIKRFAPRARRSPNGFYRGLSVRTPPGSERAQR